MKLDIIPVESPIPEHGDKYVPELDPGHPWETVGDVSPEDIEVVGNRMSDDWNQNVLMFAWRMECLKVGFGVGVKVCGGHDGCVQLVLEVWLSVRGQRSEVCWF